MNTGKQHRRTIYKGWSRKSKVEGIAHMLIKMNLELQIIKKKDEKWQEHMVALSLRWHYKLTIPL